MTTETRFARVLDRIAAGTRVVHIRDYDSRRAERNGGNGHNGHLENAVTRLEAAADELWSALER